MFDTRKDTNPFPFTVRVLGPDDKDMVLALEEKIFPEDPWTSAMVAEELTVPGRLYVGAFDAEVPLGYAGIMLGADSDIMTIGVLSHHRGCGVGRALLFLLLDAAREAGSQRVFLEVRASNDGAQALYKAAGFTAMGRIRNYFRNPREDAVTMRRTF